MKQVKVESLVDSRLVVTREPDGEKLFVVSRHTRKPLSRKTSVRVVARFLSRAGVDAWLAQQGTADGAVEWANDL